MESLLSSTKQVCEQATGLSTSWMADNTPVVRWLHNLMFYFILDFLDGLMLEQTHLREEILRTTFDSDNEYELWRNQVKLTHCFMRRELGKGFGCKAVA